MSLRSRKFLKIARSFVLIYVLWLGLVSYAFAQTSFISSLTLGPGYRNIDYGSSGTEDLASTTLDLDADAHYSIEFDLLLLRLSYTYSWRPFLVDLLDLEALINPRVDRSSSSSSPLDLGGESRVLRGESDKFSHQNHLFALLLSLGSDPLRVDISGGSRLNLTLLNYLGTTNYVQVFFQPSLRLRFSEDTVGMFGHRLLGNWSHLDIDYDYLMSDIQLQIIKELPQSSQIDARLNYRFVDYFNRSDNRKETVILGQVGGNIGFLGSIGSGFSYYPQVGFLWEIDDNLAQSSELDLFPPPKEDHNRSNLGPILNLSLIYDVGARAELSFAGRYQGSFFLGWETDVGGRLDHLIFARIGWRQGLADWVDLNVSYGLEADVSNLEKATFSDQEAKAGLNFYFFPQLRESAWQQDASSRLLEHSDRITVEREEKVRKGKGASAL